MGDPDGPSSGVNAKHNEPLAMTASEVLTMKPDAIISVRFLTMAEGGRNTAVEGQFYACPLFVDNEAFDCRLLLEGRRLELGSTYEVPIKFLYRELALPKLTAEQEVLLWEGRNVAKGQVVKIIDE